MKVTADYFLLLCASAGLIGLVAEKACAQMRPHSTMLTGAVGLNTVPSARMDPVGTLRAGVSALSPYMHGFVGAQIAPPVYVALRQSAETSTITAPPDHLFPGLDLKIRLREETRRAPQIALGLQSLFGASRMAGEYLVFSKRYYDFDLTAGLGWGRMGSAGHVKNPLFTLADSAFAESGVFDGKKVGIFGGVEYFTPLRGLSLKLDYSADRYTAERADIAGFKPPAPWSLGLNYRPSFINADFGLGMQGADNIMGRISFQGLPADLRARDADYKGGAVPFLYQARGEGRIFRTKLALQDGVSTPRQIGDIALDFQNRAPKAQEGLDIMPTRLGLQGPRLRLLRKDFSAPKAAEEIWHDTEFEDDSAAFSFFPQKRPARKKILMDMFHFNLDNQISLAEEDSGALHRTSLVAGMHAPSKVGWIDNFYALRLNIHDNLAGISETRSSVLLPVRSDVDDFTQTPLTVDTLFTSLTHSFRPGLHASLLTGYWEEMYSGTGGEVLYRPFDSRLAVGAESWLAFKRAPHTPLNLGLSGDHLVTGHVNVWYDHPVWDTTLHVSAGRYLAEDIGATLGLEKRFDNGAKLEGFVTLTNADEGRYSGLRLSLPLGGYPYVPRRSDVTFRAEPFGRDAGQRLENPLPLYDLTESFSLNHIERHWGDMNKAR